MARRALSPATVAALVLIAVLIAILGWTKALGPEVTGGLLYLVIGGLLGDVTGLALSKRDPPDPPKAP